MVIHSLSCETSFIIETLIIIHQCYDHFKFYFISLIASTLTNCVSGMTISRSINGLEKKIIWSAGHSQDIVQIMPESKYRYEGNVIDVNQKPLGIYMELVEALSTPGQCILDVCCGTGKLAWTIILLGSCAI